jgi:hypothetical protein
MRFMAACTIRNLFQVMRYVLMGCDFVSAFRDEAGGRGNEFLEGPVTFQARFGCPSIICFCGK